LVAMALMNGFDKEFKNKLTVMNYPLSIIPKFYGAVDDNLLIDLESKFPKLHFSPYIESSVMSKHSHDIEGGYIFGVNFKDEAKVNNVLAKAIDGHKFKKFDVIIGKSLKEEFDTRVDEKLIYIFTEVEPGGLAMTPKIKRFRVKSIFDSGLSAYDKAYSYTSIEALRAILHTPQNTYDGIHIYSKHPFEDIKKLQKYSEKKLKKALSFTELCATYYRIYKAYSQKNQKKEKKLILQKAINNNCDLNLFKN